VNPVTGSWLTSVNASGGGYTYRNELDPLGAEVGTGDPYVSYSSYSDIMGPISLSEERGNAFDPGGGCATVDGLPMSCSELSMRRQGGSLAYEYLVVSVQSLQAPKLAAPGQSSQPAQQPILEIERQEVFSLGVGLYQTLFPREGPSYSSEEQWTEGVFTVPQNTIRNVDPILNKIRYLGDNVNNPNLKSMLQVRFMQLLSKACGDAFKRAGLATPEEIINKGITIASSPLLNDSSNNDTLGIPESVRQKAAQSQAPAQTIRSQFTSKGPIIFFRAEAFNDEVFLDEAVVHEFIHAAGVNTFPLWGYSLGRGNDLSGYDYYQDIIDNCGYQNVIH
jgi:hypothetical protein